MIYPTFYGSQCRLFAVHMCTIEWASIGGYFIKIYHELIGPRSASLASSTVTASAKAALGGSSAAPADAAGSFPFYCTQTQIGARN
jgi:hypothetical protein